MSSRRSTGRHGNAGAPMTRAKRPHLVTSRWLTRWVKWAVVGGGILLMAEPTFGIQRALRTRMVNDDEAPVFLQQASVELVQTYSNPSQFPLAAIGDQDTGVQRSRIRHMNRLNQQIPTYVIEGALEVRNHTTKPIAAIQITTIFLNAFRERVATERRSLVQPLAPRQSKRIMWSRNIPHEEVFEVLFATSGVRFSDGSIWTPTEELVDVP